MSNDTLEFDMIVLGSGPGGYKAAVIAAQQGAKVAIVEKGLPGGTCLNQGCIPKETLMRIAKLLEEAHAFNGRGLLGEIRGDFNSALEHKAGVIANIRATLTPWLRQLGIRFFQGEARFVDNKRLRLSDDSGDKELVANRIIIAAGGRPREHDVCKTDGRLIINSKQFMFDLEHLPRRVLCVGGGAIGTELGYLLHRFGAEVTILEKADRLLEKPCIPERASNTLERKFKKLGIHIRKQDNVVACDKFAEEVEVEFANGERQRFDMILVAIGRQPNSEALGLEAAGIAVDAEGFVRVNEFLETTCPGVYAVGDIKPGPMTANAAFHDAKVAVANALGGNRVAHNYNRVPIVIDSALPIASVGLTEERAEEAGFEADVARINLAGSTKARITHDSEGYIEVVHDEETGQLLGGSIVGPQAGEMIQLLTAACQSSRGLWFFTDISYSHPSWNEELENAIGGCVSSFSKPDEEIFRPGIYALS